MATVCISVIKKRPTASLFSGLPSLVSRPQSSEDLKAADEEEGWVESGDPEDNNAGGEAKMRPQEDAGLHALLGVNSIVVSL